MLMEKHLGIPQREKAFWVDFNLILTFSMKTYFCRKEDLVDMVNYIDLDMLSYLQRLYPEFINSTTHKSAHVSYLQMVSVLYG